MTVKTKISEIGSIQFGANGKGELTGDSKYLLSSHFDDLYNPSKFEKSFIQSDSKLDRYLLEENDIILAAKGHRIFSWAYQSQFGKCIPSSLFYIIKTNPNEILGEYLALYLNSEKIQHQLKFLGGGSAILSIRKKELMQLEITIPGLEKQKRLIEFSQLMNQEIAITEEILNQKKVRKNALINEILNSQGS
jgi:restriction endonuclease S subunit